MDKEDIGGHGWFVSKKDANTPICRMVEDIGGHQARDTSEQRTPVRPKLPGRKLRTRTEGRGAFGGLGTI